MALLTTPPDRLSTPRLPAACLVLFAAIAGCYQPHVRDCTVTCERAGDCASGQICGADGFCARPEAAGQCALAGRVDAREPADARPDPDSADASVADARIAADAARPPDASVDAMVPTGSLHVVITGAGMVTVSPPDVTCRADVKSGTTCTYAVAIGASLTAVAATIHAKDVFKGWTSGACTGQGATCVFVAGPGTTTIGAAFDDKKGPD